ncbi:nicotinate-nucleotide--dimethylbenzimidazole phosphoribosyltransferase, partial [Streptomyces sp. NPDC002537]
WCCLAWVGTIVMFWYVTVPAQGPEYLDVPHADADAQQAPRLGEVPQQQPGTWDAQPQQPTAQPPAAPAADAVAFVPAQGTAAHPADTGHVIVPDGTGQTAPGTEAVATEQAPAGTPVAAPQPTASAPASAPAQNEAAAVATPAGPPADALVDAPVAASADATSAVAGGAAVATAPVATEPVPTAHQAVAPVAAAPLVAEAHLTPEPPAPAPEPVQPVPAPQAPAATGNNPAVVDAGSAAQAPQAVPPVPPVPFAEGAQEQAPAVAEAVVVPEAAAAVEAPVAVEAPAVVESAVAPVTEAAAEQAPAPAAGADQPAPAVVTEAPAPVEAAPVDAAPEQPVPAAASAASAEGVQDAAPAGPAAQIVEPVQAVPAAEAVQAAPAVAAQEAPAAVAAPVPAEQQIAEPVAVTEPAAVPVLDAVQQPQAVAAPEDVVAQQVPVQAQAPATAPEAVTREPAPEQTSEDLPLVHGPQDTDTAHAVAAPAPAEPQPVPAEAAAPVAEAPAPAAEQPAEPAPAPDERTAPAAPVHIPAPQQEPAPTGAEPVTPQPVPVPAPRTAVAVEAPQDAVAAADAPLPEPVQPGTDATETPDAPDAAAPEEQEPVGPAAVGYGDAERAAVHRVMRERRDIRNGFRTDPIPHEVLLRVLEAAHTAPSVGHSQPWDFVVIRSAETRQAMHELAERQRDAYAKSLPKGRAKQFKELKIEAILETPVNIVVTADPTRGGRHTLGRHTQPQMAPYSSALAVENLWLAARAEGLGVGWVSFFDEREMVRELGLPEHLEVVAYLCVGYVDEFPDEPELMQAGWSKRRPLSWVVHEETYGRRALPGEDPHDLLSETLRGIRPLDAKALGEAWDRQKRMTKPAGALGMLEIISAQLCGLSRKCPPPIPEPAAVAIFAGDHGVHAQGVTAWPQEVTSQMVANFLGGGAVCNAFANQVGAEVCVVDVGVAGELPSTPGLLPRKIRPGTSDFTAGPAMSREEALRAIEVGIETARDLVAAGNKALLTGEMGIANTTVSAALIAVYTEADPTEITGRGTGINDEMHARKVDVVRRALELHQPDPQDPIGVLAAVGGLEHAALVGLILGGASLRTPVILDGVSAGAAALVARAIAPEALAACIAGHRSAEPGHVAALTKLGLRPLVDLDLRLGEGTGALLALPIVQSAARAMHEVATFDAAGVTEKG